MPLDRGSIRAVPRIVSSKLYLKLWLVQFTDG